MNGKNDCDNFVAPMGLNPANRFLEFLIADKCSWLLTRIIGDCDQQAMKHWKTENDFTNEQMGMIIQLKAIRTHLCEIRKEYDNDTKAWAIPVEEEEKVREYLNKYK